MMPDREFLSQLLDMMTKRLDSIDAKVDDNTRVTNKVLEQAKATNGRVTRLEHWQKEHTTQSNTEKISEAWYNTPGGQKLFVAASIFLTALALLAATIGGFRVPGLG